MPTVQQISEASRACDEKEVIWQYDWKDSPDVEALSLEDTEALKRKLKDDYLAQSKTDDTFFLIPRSFKFTEAAIADLPFEHALNRQRLHWDDEMECFGVVVARQAKMYFVQKDLKLRLPDGSRMTGKSVRINIGNADAWTVEDARKKARAYIVEIDNGIDPRTTKEKAAWNTTIHSLTLRRVIEEYLTRDLKPVTKQGYKNTLEHVFGDWMNTPVVKITPFMVVTLHEKIRKTAKYHADLAMRILHAVINVAMEKYRNPETMMPLLAVNPVVITNWAKAKKRERALNDDELPKFFDALDSVSSDITIPSAAMGTAYLEFVLFTGVRRSEAAQLQWKDVDLERRTVRFDDTKNGKPHVLPLTDHLVRLLQRRHDASHQDWVFPACGRNAGSGHIAEPRYIADKVIQISGLDRFCIHDLRRTFAVTALDLGLDSYVVKHLLNHKGSGDVTFQHYNPKAIERLRAPMQIISDHFCVLMARGKGIKLAS